jgi:autotransporter-associated beta strand protein
MKKKIASMLLVAGLSFTVQAQTAYWLNQTVGTNWSSTVIWTPTGSPGTGAAKDDIAVMSRNAGNLAGSRPTTNDVSISLSGIYIGTTQNANGRQTLIPAGGSTITFTNLSGGSAFIVKTNNTGNIATGTDTINTPIILGVNLNVSNRSSLGSLTLAGNISQSGGSRSLTIDNLSASNITMSVSNSYSGGTTLKNGILNINNGGAVGTGALDIQSGGNAVFNLANATMNNSISNAGLMTMMGNGTLTGDIEGSGSINHDASGTFTLSGSNTYSGTTTVTAGTLIGAADHVFGGTGNITVAAGAALTLQGGLSNDYINDSARLILNSTSVLNLNFTGTDTIQVLSLDGGATKLPNGTYTAAQLAARGTGTYTGSGSLKVGAKVLRLIGITSKP